MNARLCSRLEMGILAELRCPDVEMRIAILEMKAAAEQADIPRDVLEFLATRIESNIRVLEGALFKICAYSSLNQVELALPLVEEIVADYSTDGTERRVTMQEIVDYVHTDELPGRRHHRAQAQQGYCLAEANRCLPVP